MSTVSLKQARTILADVPSRFLLLKDFCEAAGITPTAENLHAVKDAIEAMEKSAKDVFDLGLPDAPMLVPYRGSQTTHGINFERVVMPDDPRVKSRKSAEERKSTPQVNLMPAIRLVSATDWDKYSDDKALKESLRTGVLKTLADLPDNCRILFGDVKSVTKTDKDGWALATVLVKVG